MILRYSNGVTVQVSWKDETDKASIQQRTLIQLDY